MRVIKYIIVAACMALVLTVVTLAFSQKAYQLVEPYKIPGTERTVIPKTGCFPQGRGLPLRVVKTDCSGTRIDSDTFKPINLLGNYLFYFAISFLIIMTTRRYVNRQA